MGDAVTLAEQRWNITLRWSRSRDEYIGPCPFCGGGDDRFNVWKSKGNYWCRKCGAKGFVDEEDQPKADTTTDRLDRLEREQERAKRERQEMERRLSALERMARCQDHLAYHHALTDQAREYWHNEGINDQSIKSYLLGFCHRCPTASNGSASYTIPVINGGVLLNIRHRLVEPEGGKYRPHMPGLGSQLFNADFLEDPGIREIIITEGEKKSIVLAQWGFPNVGILGKRTFKREWVQQLERFPRILVALDPDAKESAWRLASMFSDRGRVVDLPCKADDMFAQYGATPGDFAAYLKFARPVKGEFHD